MSRRSTAFPFISCPYTSLQSFQHKSAMTVSSITWRRPRREHDGLVSKLWVGSHMNKPDRKHGLPICQNSQLSKRHAALLCCKKKTPKGFYHDDGGDPIFTKRKLCVQVSWIGPSISRGVSQIEIWHLEPQHHCSLALIWTLASDKFVCITCPWVMPLTRFRHPWYFAERSGFVFINAPFFT